MLFKPKVLWHLPEGRTDLRPYRATPGAMAYDLYSPTEGTIPPGGRLLINTLVAVTLPKGYAIILGSRSGLANKGITVQGGWIDNDYRGLIRVLLYNHGTEPHTVVAGSRIAQAMIVKTQAVKEAIAFTYPDTNSTKRGAGGFGSTGK